jgi:dimethylargininase
VDRLALTRAVSPSIADCELTHVERASIDYARACEQHVAYEAALVAAGCSVLRLPSLPGHPDAVFVEDTVVDFGVIAVCMRPGAVSRRGEVGSVEDEVRRHRPLRHVVGPGTVDGGDVLVAGRTVFVGRTARTNDEGIEQLRAHLVPFDFEVRAVPVHGCLHLKTAVTAFAPGRMVFQPEWVGADTLVGHELLPIDPAEPFSANVLAVGSKVIVPAAHARTAARLRAEGIEVIEVPADELARAEGGVTCCSVILEGVRA